MQTSRKLLRTTSLLCGLGAMSAHCASTECDQFTDCAQGYTCAAGKCVLPGGPPQDGAADASTDSRADVAPAHDSATLIEGGAKDAAGAREGAANPSDASHDGPHDGSGQGTSKDATSTDTASPDATAGD
jgi:hypothetical protein